MDFDILQEFGMGDQARECGGLGGMLGSFQRPCDAGAAAGANRGGAGLH
ncbi:hypothetical protein ACLBWT_21030 [Paenibacillus sp. D51F]